MNRRLSVLLILCTLLLVVAGCAKAKPTAEMVPVEPAPATTVPASATPLPPTEEPAAEPTAAPVSQSEAEQPVVEVEGPAAPDMPPEEPVPAGQFVDLLWGWAEAMEADQWFELQVKPDLPETEYEVFDWYSEPKVRITSADLLPGVYLWRVVVVQGRDEARGDEISAMSAERRFILTRPSVSGRLLPTLEFTATPTKTPVRWYPTLVPSATPLPPTPTSTPDPYAQPTAPTPTNTPGSYVEPSATPLVPTATTTPGGYVEPTATDVIPTTVPTDTPAPKATDTPAPTATSQPPVPTATPGEYVAPTEVPTVEPTAVPPGPTLAPTDYPSPA